MQNIRARVVGSILNDVMTIDLIEPIESNLSSLAAALGSTQSLTKINTRKSFLVVVVKRGRRVRLANSPLPVSHSLQNM
jgi:hypothetical protein